MSYLLKALEKAEQERQQNLQSDNTETVTQVQKASLPKSLVVVVVVLLALTLWQVWPNKQTPLESNTIEQYDEEFTNKENSIEISEVNESVETQGAPQENIAALPVNVKPKDLSELTPQELARIPSLNLASHIYSSAAEFRSVVINDQAYKEGALIRPGLKLEEINQNGIVINIHGQKVELPKGISWVASQNAK
jgi:hypothetical protein